MIDLSQCDVFAKELEHLFHGKSSGLDIAGVAAEGGSILKQVIQSLFNKNISQVFIFM